MPNLAYSRGRAREYKIRDELQAEGYGFVVRTAGSHSPVDIIAIKETWVDPQYGLCFTGKLVQSKTSTKFKKIRKTQESIETPSGTLLIERWEYPVNENSIKHKATTKSVQSSRVRATRVGKLKHPARKNRTVPKR